MFAHCRFFSTGDGVHPSIFKCGPGVRPGSGAFCFLGWLCTDIRLADSCFLIQLLYCKENEHTSTPKTQVLKWKAGGVVKRGASMGPSPASKTRQDHNDGGELTRTCACSVHDQKEA